MNTYTKQRLAFWTLIAIAATVVYGAFAAFAHIARADPAVAGAWHDAEPAALAGSTATWLLAALVALRAVEMALKWLAPRTPTKLDDQAYAVIHTVRETAEEILTHVKPPADRPPGPLPANPERGSVRMWPLVIMAGVAIGVASQAMWLGGCAETKEYATAGKTAVIQCGKEYGPELVRAVAKWGVAALTAHKVDWSAVETDAIALGKEAGSCAVGAFLAALRTSPTPQVATLGGGPDDVVLGQAVLARVSGGAEVKL